MLSPAKQMLIATAEAASTLQRADDDLEDIVDMDSLLVDVIHTRMKRFTRADQPGS